MSVHPWEQEAARTIDVQASLPLELPPKVFANGRQLGTKSRNKVPCTIDRV